MEVPKFRPLFRAHIHSEVYDCGIFMHMSSCLGAGWTLLGTYGVWRTTYPHQGLREIGVYPS